MNQRNIVLNFSETTSFFLLGNPLTNFLNLWIFLLILNSDPFDYFIFNFALHLLNDNETRGFYDSVNTAYFALVCDYLIHFLPVDPSVGVQPSIPYFRGKVPATALQTANRYKF